ncbi:hypothetical protein HUE56_29150 (plasmid) [Azospirillum oryzae]|uniref:Uncharacterized protein n=1 Tax=Azospirillum oryzae TaxID=286727 RepID=A0A6N1ATI9_9PROT|nr:hypothetical protein [Azospirillum oryzae]KAA0585423.1 hypothetical protein FZ938_25960 [Azospirillum oryzae]QKS54578.1 hypothetical protein HUE56_29150 [Azospirillum oryzae]
MLLGDGLVHTPLHFLAERSQLAGQPFCLCLAFHNEPAVPRPPAVVGESQEGESSRTPFAALSSSQSRQPAELDQARL